MTSDYSNHTYRSID